jgi:hypothetical protein
VIELPLGLDAAGPAPQRIVNVAGEAVDTVVLR